MQVIYIICAIWFLLGAVPMWLFLKSMNDYLDITLFDCFMIFFSGLLGPFGALPVGAVLLVNVDFSTPVVIPAKYKREQKK